MSHDDTQNPKIEVYKKRNQLKNKLGLDVQTDVDGQIDPDMVKEADALITAMCKDCNKNIGLLLMELLDAWAGMSAMAADGPRDEKVKDIFNFAHEIKDIAALCGYSLAAHFAESLRDYIAETTCDLKNQRIIIQAHIDALVVIQKNDIKDDAGPVAEELKEMVAVAVNKYK